MAKSSEFKNWLSLVGETLKKIHKREMVLAMLQATLTGAVIRLGYDAVIMAENPSEVRALAITGYTTSSLIFTAAGLHFTNRALRDV